jgi:hypothetical protein
MLLIDIILVQVTSLQYNFVYTEMDKKYQERYYSSYIYIYICHIYIYILWALGCSAGIYRYLYISKNGWQNIKPELSK